MGLLSSGLGWLNDAPRHRTGSRLLQVAVGLMIWFRLATEFRFASYFWGPHGVGQGKVQVFGPWIGRHLDVAFHTELGTRVVLLVLAAAAVGLIAGRFTRVAAGSALLVEFLLEARLPELLDGGDNITRIILLYMIFLLPPRAAGRPGGLGTFLHNVAVLAIGAQLCVVYITAGFMKANGLRWSQGTALYLVSQIDWFSLPSSRWIFRNPFITTFATYGTVFFQLWFPIVIFSRLKTLWVLMGIGLHLGIAYTMGLVPFSTVMIGLELFLLDDRQWEQWRTAVRKVRDRLFAEWLPSAASRDAESEAP
jgi:hypothetical protein